MQSFLFVVWILELLVVRRLPRPPLGDKEGGQGEGGAVERVRVLGLFKNSRDNASPLYVSPRLSHSYLHVR